MAHSLRSLRRFLALSSVPTFAALAACGGASAPAPVTQVGPNAPPAGEPPSAATPSAPSAGNSLGDHKIAMAAVSCWFGGVWADAIGEAPENRKSSDEGRCADVVRQVWGGADDKAKYEQLRGLDERAVEDVISKVGEATPSGRELRAFVEAQREATDARRAGSRVKKDMDGEREHDKLTADEAESAKALSDDDALDALLKLQVNDLTHEAHALGVLIAMARIEASRGLPRHLKVYAMQGPLFSLFGMPLPTNLPTDATQPLPKGAYLTYVSDAAKTAGHPVPDTAKTPKEREPIAWSGVLEGITEKLRPDVGAVPTDSELPSVLDRVEHRLEAEFKAERNALAIGATETPQTAKKGAKPAAPPKKGPAQK